MSKALLEKEIELLKRRLAETKATKPAHDTTGVYQATLLEIEDELSDKRHALSRLAKSEGSPSAEKNQ